MPLNTMQFGHVLLMMIGGIVVLGVFAVTFGLKHKSKMSPGSKGHRKGRDEVHPSDIHEEQISPDGYIDDFNHEIEEAGGGMPPIVKVFLPGIILWYVLYLIIYIVIV